MAISKDVKKLRKFEQDLLSNYQLFLKSCEKLIKDFKDNEEILQVVYKCLTELLISKTHFNFRVNIIMTLVDRLGIEEPKSVSELCCDAIKTLFRNDNTGEASLETVKLITKLIKSKSFNVPGNVLDTFLCLRLHNELSIEKQEHVKPKKKNTMQYSRSIKKVMKEYKELDNELKEAEAVVDLEERKKMVLYN